jgi:hypothetical protein
VLEACEGQLQWRHWRGGVAPAVALERGRAPSGSTGEGERRCIAREASGSRKLEASGSRKQRRVLGFLMGLGLAWAAQGTKLTDLVSQVDD